MSGPDVGGVSCLMSTVAHISDFHWIQDIKPQFIMFSNMSHLSHDIYVHKW